jgi:beta-galactosidase
MNKNLYPFKINIQSKIIVFSFFALISFSNILSQDKDAVDNNFVRLRISINEGWKFYKYKTAENTDNLIYDVRPEIKEKIDNRPADAKPTEAETITTEQIVLKPWILPTGNDLLNDTSKHYIRPEEQPGSNFPFVSKDFDDSLWENVNLPHDWAIKGPFIKNRDDEIGGSMGRLPSPGVAWYRKKLYIPKSDSGKSIFLDVDGAMSYAMVWLNGNLVGGWPYGYSSWSLNLTPYIIPGSENQLAIRLDNPPASSRWYPGGGLYRNVWLTKTNPVHIGQWGTFVTTHNISRASVEIDLKITINNDSKKDETVKVVTQIFLLNDSFNKTNDPVITFNPVNAIIVAGTKSKIESSAELENPKLWGPPPTQIPNLYLALTTLYQNGKPIDQYETRFGIRSLRLDPDSGIFINNELVKLNGVNQHHDLGALGAAFNKRSAERQLEILREMGCNSIRMSHNPPAPELLELTDRMGFFVMDEAFDVWVMKKTPLDFHLIFPDWYEQDLRAMIRRDKNCPSVIMWSFGNEVGEQYTGDDGAAIATKLNSIIKDEDPTRPTTCAMNWSKPNMPLPGVPDIISLNYQGEGIRQDSMFEGTERIRTAPMYDSFHEKFPGKVILSSETASAASSRGIYLFPVVPDISSPIRDGRGGDSRINQVSSYELYAVDFGSSADKVFRTIDQHSFVAGEFVWNGFDYLGEPTPYYEARSSYTGIIDLAGFKKDRFYLYQSHWKPELPMTHILPHWNWPERVGEITPVHVFTSGDEAELFLNGESLGRKKKGQFEYRLRWDEVKYQPGELKVVAYKNGNMWAEDVVKTADEPAKLEALADRNEISSDGKDLSFITVRVTDKNGLTVPVANNSIKFTIEGPGEIIASDNGDPTDLVPFPSYERRAFNGSALVVVRSQKESTGKIIVVAESQGLKRTQLIINSN